jgi:hypothetical protein
MSIKSCCSRESIREGGQRHGRMSLPAVIGLVAVGMLGSVTA